MKNILKIGVIYVIILSLVSFIVVAICPGEVIPDTPHSFRGYAKYSSSVLTSKTVIATLGGIAFSTTTDSNGYYELDAFRCNSTPTSITFTVCTRTASETATFASSTGTPTQQNLTITSACPTDDSGGGGGGGGGGAATVVTPIIEEIEAVGEVTAFELIDIIRDFFSGTSSKSAFDIIDLIRAFYGG